MKKFEINYRNNTIEITKAFAKKAGSPYNNEYAELMQIRKDNPNYRVVVVANTKRTRKNSLRGLNYDFMKQYIERHDTEDQSIMAEFNKMTVKSKDNLATQRYGEVKKWFLEQYPEICEAA